MAKPKRIPQKVKDHVRISEYSDLEIMGVLHDLNGTGEVGTEAMARRLFGDMVEKSFYLIYAKKCVGSRMAWMRRFGLVEKADTPGTWRLSPPGEVLLAGALRGSLKTQIEGIDGRHTLHLAQAVGIRIQSSDAVVFKAMERQLRFNIQQRKRQ